MGVGPIDAVKVALGRAGMTIDDVDVMELNEAFAAQVLPSCDELGIEPLTVWVNVHGGASRVGHPFGMTGARITTTLLNALELGRPKAGSVWRPCAPPAVRAWPWWSSASAERRPSRPRAARADRA